MNRRHFFFRLFALSLVPALPAIAKERSALMPLRKTKSEWKALLPGERFRILFEEDTERPFTSELNSEKRSGTYICAACALPLFDAAHKFDSGTGWPSFWDVLPGAVATRREFRLVWPRTEYHCARCGGHQGHVFKDGPAPTGLRYCNNGLALKFVPTGETLPALVT
jgi:peptide-methionine (R)-S-oxide reductase